MNPFDQLGRLRTDLDEQEIAGLSVTQRDALMAMIATSLKMEEADQAFAAAEKATRAAVRDVATRIEECQQIAPKRTFHDEWREVVAQLPPNPVDPKLLKRIRAAAQVLEGANRLLEQRRGEEIDAKQRRDECRHAFAKALNGWSSVDDRPRSAADLMRERSRREIEQKLAESQNCPPPETAEASRHLHQIDRVLSSGARGASANLGHRRPTRPVLPQSTRQHKLR